MASQVKRTWTFFRWIISCVHVHAKYGNDDIYIYVIATIALSFLLVYSLILLLTLFVIVIFSNEKLKRKWCILLTLSTQCVNDMCSVLIMWIDSKECMKEIFMLNIVHLMFTFDKSCVSTIQFYFYFSLSFIFFPIVMDLTSMVHGTVVGFVALLINILKALGNTQNFPPLLNDLPKDIVVNYL